MTSTEPKFTVMKPFHSAQRRFRPGDVVTAADLIWHSFDLAHAREKGLVRSPDGEAPTSAPERTRKAK